MKVPHVVYLSRRNLLALLSKLEWQKAGAETHCAIIKQQVPFPVYRQSIDEILVVAVEDDQYYGAQMRPAGAMVDEDEIHLPKPITGTIENVDGESS